MSRTLSEEEERAFEKLRKLRVGALFAYDRMSALRVAAHLLEIRMDAKKADGAIWLVSSSEQALVDKSLDMLLKGMKKNVRISTFQSLSHSADVFFDLLRMTKQMRIMLIIDDGLYIKNVNTVRTHRVWMISQLCPYRLLIAGAPFERNQADMFSQWYALDARILGYMTYWGFYVNHIKKGRLINADYLSRAVAPYSACIGRGEKEETQRNEYVWQFRLSKEAYEEYWRVVLRFERKAQYSQAGIYRMLSACHLAASGRRIVCDYPLETESIYNNALEDPRIQALLAILSKYDSGQTLIVCRFHFEIDAVTLALSNVYGEQSVYSPAKRNREARFYVESLYLEKRALLNKKFRTVIYYSQNWSLRKRRNKEDAFFQAGNVTVINIVAADTIDALIVRRVWKKEKSIKEIYDLLMGRKEEADAQGLQG